MDEAQGIIHPQVKFLSGCEPLKQTSYVCWDGHRADIPHLKGEKLERRKEVTRCKKKKKDLVSSDLGSAGSWPLSSSEH